METLTSTGNPIEAPDRFSLFQQRLPEDRRQGKG